MDLNFGQKEEEKIFNQHEGELVPIQAFDLDQAKKDIAIYTEGIEKMLVRIEELKVENPETNHEATSIGATASDLLKRIETQRKAIIAEPDGFVGKVNSFCRQFTEKLKQVKDLAGKKTGQYALIIEQERKKREMRARQEAEELQRRLEREAQEEQKKRQEEAQSKAEKEAKIKGEDPTQVIVAEVRKIEVPTVVTPVIPKRQTTTRTDAGSASLTQKWTFEILAPNIASIIIEEIRLFMGTNPASSAIQSLDSLQSLISYMIFSDIKLRDAIKAGIREIPGVRIFQEAKSRFNT